VVFQLGAPGGVEDIKAHPQAELEAVEGDKNDNT
jgi:hypothetical protein